MFYSGIYQVLTMVGFFELHEESGERETEVWAWETDRGDDFERGRERGGVEGRVNEVERGS